VRRGAISTSVSPPVRFTRAARTAAAIFACFAQLAIAGVTFEAPFANAALSFPGASAPSPSALSSLFVSIPSGAAAPAGSCA
jgi:hypothetical protein